MHIFRNLADASFITSPTGERLFYGVPFSRPYLIPDAVTEQRLYRKYLWIGRFEYGWLVFGQAILFTGFPEVIRKSSWFILYFIMLIAVFWLSVRVLFYRDLKKMRQVNTDPRSHFSFKQAADRNETSRFVWLFVVSLLIMAFGAWAIASPFFSYAFGIMFTTYGGYISVLSCCCLYLKIYGCR